MTKKIEEDQLLDMALKMLGYSTDHYSRDVFVRTLDKVRELGSSFALSDYIKIEFDLCEKHNLDPETKRPFEFDNKKILIVKPKTEGGFSYYKEKDQDFTTNIEEANDFKTFDFAEKQISSLKLEDVMIIPFYKK